MKKTGSDVLNDRHDFFTADSGKVPLGDGLSEAQGKVSGAARGSDVLDLGDVLTGAETGHGVLPAELGAAISGGFLRVETVDATTARIVLDTDGSGSETATVPVVTLANLSGGFDAATLLTTLLNNDQPK